MVLFEEVAQKARKTEQSRNAASHEHSDDQQIQILDGARDKSVLFQQKQDETPGDAW